MVREVRVLIFDGPSDSFVTSLGTVDDGRAYVFLPSVDFAGVGRKRVQHEWVVEVVVAFPALLEARSARAHRRRIVGTLALGVVGVVLAGISASAFISSPRGTSPGVAAWSHDFGQSRRRNVASERHERQPHVAHGMRNWRKETLLAVEKLRLQLGFELERQLKMPKRPSGEAPLAFVRQDHFLAERSKIQA